MIIFTGGAEVALFPSEDSALIYCCGLSTNVTSEEKTFPVSKVVVEEVLINIVQLESAQKNGSLESKSW